MITTEVMVTDTPKDDDAAGAAAAAAMGGMGGMGMGM